MKRRDKITGRRNRERCELSVSFTILRKEVDVSMGIEEMLGENERSGSRSYRQVYNIGEKERRGKFELAIAREGYGRPTLTPDCLCARWASSRTEGTGAGDDDRDGVARDDISKRMSVIVSC